MLEWEFNGRKVPANRVGDELANQASATSTLVLSAAGSELGRKMAAEGIGEDWSRLAAFRLRKPSS